MAGTPFYPMVLLIIIPIFYGYFIGKINPIFRQTQIVTLIVNDGKCIYEMFRVNQPRNVNCDK